MTAGRRPRRVAVYVDCRVVRLEDTVRVEPASAPFLDFAERALEGVARPVLIGRGDSEARIATAPAADSWDAAMLPSYDSLADLGAVVRVLPASLRVVWRVAGRVDGAWVFGPHPVAILLAAAVRLRGRQVVLGVRTDPIAYFRARAASRPARVAARILDGTFRLMARVMPVTVVGRTIAERYRRVGADVLPMRVSVVPARSVAAAPRPPADPGRPLELLAVGRVDREKAPDVLLAAVARLAASRGGGVRLRWAGTGPLLEATARRAEDFGIAASVELLGFVRHGPELERLYLDADVFVHTALTEGIPQVLFEAQAAGLPIVATDVGSVAEVIRDGRNGLLVPPRDPRALADALERLDRGPALARTLASAGLEEIRTSTIEAETARVGRFLSSRLFGRRGAGPGGGPLSSDGSAPRPAS